MNPLYHGTRAAFRGRGGLLLPAASHHGPTNHDASRLDDRDEWVYVTPDLALAWAYARAAAGRNVPRVLVVRPAGRIEHDWSTVNGEDVESYRCEYATVFAVLREEMTP